MTRNIDPTKFNTRSQEIVTQLRAPEAVSEPSPATYGEAAGLLRGYFEARATSASETGERDKNFENALDDVVSALGGFYSRDEITGRITDGGLMGQRPGDVGLEAAINAALEARLKAEEHGHVSATTSSHSIEAVRTITDMLESKDTEIKDEGKRPLRQRIADELRRATRAAEVDPAVYPLLGQIGMHVVDAISELASIAANHERDTDAPNFRDYLAKHISSALELSEA